MMLQRGGAYHTKEKYVQVGDTKGQLQKHRKKSTSAKKIRKINYQKFRKWWYYARLLQTMHLLWVHVQKSSMKKWILLLRCMMHGSVGKKSFLKQKKLTNLIPVWHKRHLSSQLHLHPKLTTWCLHLKPRKSLKTCLLPHVRCHHYHLYLHHYCLPLPVYISLHGR